MKKILITGINGQIGSEFSEKLENIVGAENIIGLDIRPSTPPYRITHEIVDVTKKDALRHIIERYHIDTIFHLASILSARGEQNPDQAWDINTSGLKNVLDLCRGKNIKVFWPSSIAVFGPTTPKESTPQDTVVEPSTMYGITKRAGEMLCHYYFEKFQVDVRSVRYPGIISYKTEPGGGTTDYAVEIFYGALRNKAYTSYVSRETCLPMMYMDDAVRAAIQIMQCDPKQIKIRSSYNLTGVSFTVEQMVKEIQKYIPEFRCNYAPDFRQQIANSWPRSIDDSCARRDWHWQHQYDLAAITKVMLEKLREKLGL